MSLKEGLAEKVNNIEDGCKVVAQTYAQHLKNIWDFPVVKGTAVVGLGIGGILLFRDTNIVLATVFGLGGVVAGIGIATDIFKIAPDPDNYY